MPGVEAVTGEQGVDLAPQPARDPAHPPENEQAFDIDVGRFARPLHDDALDMIGPVARGGVVCLRNHEGWMARFYLDVKIFDVIFT
ncbi:MAG: hypothetical protein Kow00133_16520 [Amphiplicatus sp.]